MKKMFASLIVLLGLCVIADAQCRTIVRAQVQHAAVAQQVHHNAYVAPLAAVYQAIPVFSVGYAPDNKEEFQLLRLQLLQMQQQLLNLQQPSPPAPIPQALPQKQPAIQPMPPAVSQRGDGDHPAIGLMKKNCAACHTDSNAKAKGGGLTLFAAAGIAPLNDRQLLSVAKEVFSGRMPKNAKLSDEDVGQVMDWLDTVK